MKALAGFESTVSQLTVYVFVIVITEDKRTACCAYLQQNLKRLSVFVSNSMRSRWLFTYTNVKKSMNIYSRFKTDDSIIEQTAVLKE